MPFIETTNAIALHYLNWADGPAVVLSHGWMLGGDKWEYEVPPRCTRRDHHTPPAHDRQPVA